MSKILTIHIENFKAITNLEMDFKGCTAIITGGNNQGKTSFLRGIPDRIRYIRPEVMVKAGSTRGKGEMTLDSGEKFLWEFDATGKDKLVYVSDKGIKSGLTQELGAKFFPAVFDIDRFLQSGPKDRMRQFQAIVGLDFTDIDARYKSAYDDRTEKNRDAENYHAKLTAMLVTEEVKRVDLADLQTKKETEANRLNTLYLQNKKANDATRQAYQEEKDKAQQEFDLACKDNKEKSDLIGKAKSHLAFLVEMGYAGKEVFNWIESLPQPLMEIKRREVPEPTLITPELPESSELQAIDAKILAASETNEKAIQWENYVAQKKVRDEAQALAKAADDLVKSIEAERAKLIASANMPEGISITPEGITVDGLPLDKNQLSTSKLYCAALRIASMNLGEVKTLYFDASFLDKNTLGEIQEWANTNDLQLLIERPDWDGGEIKYELIENEQSQ